MLDNIIFGDNQFFGVNHMSEEKAQTQDEKFQNLEAIIQVIDSAYETGIRAFMLNTNQRAMDICNYFRETSDKYADICFYPSMPYAHKYANAVAEKGIFGAVKDTILNDSTAGDILNMMTKGGMSLIEKDMIKVMQLLVDIEMKIFRDLKVKVIFLQNIVTDLLLGFGVKEVFSAFYDHIKNKYNVEAGFVTLNMARLADFLDDCGIENPIICSAINKAGYFMNPNQKVYEKALAEKRFRPIAMSILASGAIRPQEAVEYVCRQLKIPSVVFGASSRNHIMETKTLIEAALHNDGNAN